MTPEVRIDFVSDVACPWCAIGLASLEQAASRLGDAIRLQWQFQPFELNPQMPPEGEDVTAHLTRKYDSSPEQQAAIREQIRARGAALGFAFNPAGRGRIWNTFDAHRLLHWAGTLGGDAQRRLKHALLRVYHGRGENPGDPDVLATAATSAGLDADAARQVLASGQYAAEVRAAEREWTDAGIHAVPAVVLNRQFLVSGGQPPEVFEQALRRAAGLA